MRGNSKRMGPVTTSAGTGRSSQGRARKVKQGKAMQGKARRRVGASQQEGAAKRKKGRWQPAQGCRRQHQEQRRQHLRSPPGASHSPPPPPASQTPRTRLQGKAGASAGRLDMAQVPRTCMHVRLWLGMGGVAAGALMPPRQAACAALALARPARPPHRTAPYASRPSSSTAATRNDLRPTSWRMSEGSRQGEGRGGEGSTSRPCLTQAQRSPPSPANPLCPFPSQRRTWPTPPHLCMCAHPRRTGRQLLAHPRQSGRLLLHHHPRPSLGAAKRPHSPASPAAIRQAIMLFRVKLPWLAAASMVAKVRARPTDSRSAARGWVACSGWGVRCTTMCAARLEGRAATWRALQARGWRVACAGCGPAAPPGRGGAARAAERACGRQVPLRHHLAPLVLRMQPGGQLEAPHGLAQPLALQACEQEGQECQRLQARRPGGAPRQQRRSWPAAIGCHVAAVADQCTPAHASAAGASAAGASAASASSAGAACPSSSASSAAAPAQLTAVRSVGPNAPTSATEPSSQK